MPHACALAGPTQTDGRTAPATAFGGGPLASISHELRTPLAGVTALLHLMSKTALDPIQVGYLATLQEMTGQLGRAIDAVAPPPRPARAPEAPIRTVEPRAPAAPGAARRILVVEDHPTLRFLAGRILEEGGHRVALAEDGQAGVERLQAEPFDLCLMDLRMPRLNGADAVARIRSDPDPRVRATRVVALSADVVDFDEESLAAMGFDGFMPKPIDARDLLAMVSLTDTTVPS